MVSGWVHRFKYFFSSFKGEHWRPPLRPCRRWSDDLYGEDPTLEYLYPLPFFLSFPLLLLLCILSFLLPTSKAVLPESHKTSVLTKNTGMPLRSFKGDFSGVGDGIETLLMSRWMFSDTFSIGKHRGLGYSHGNSKHHHKLKTHGARRQKTRVTSHYRKK